MLNVMARAFAIAAGVLIALAGTALVFVGVAHLAPHVLTMRAGRTPIIVFLVVVLGVLQARRWRASRTKPVKRAQRTSPIGLNL